ncbi:MAG: hypothetical protein BMS9Abin39_0417 [Ignavibacteria bacterium]|nr:MAG: hypothetical protein BMS9Abin39_0417 [Ignavibacteria bacterium]
MENKSFNIENFDIKLDTNIIGRNFIYAEEIGSTNKELLNHKKFYHHHGSVFLADSQTKGRGTKDSIWRSEKAMNLTFSILINDQRYLKKNASLLNYSASLAIVLSIENLFQLHAELKWPNDVLINGHKVAGILMESISKGSKIERLVIGLGLNVNQNLFQGKFNIAPTSLKKELGYTIEREKLLAEILNNFETILDKVILSTYKVLNEWKSRCPMIGERITVVDDKGMKDGIFEDIDENGFLVLRSHNKTLTLHFGDVSIL